MGYTNWDWGDCIFPFKSEHSHEAFYLTLITLEAKQVPPKSVRFDGTSISTNSLLRVGIWSEGDSNR